MKNEPNSFRIIKFDNNVLNVYEESKENRLEVDTAVQVKNEDEERQNTITTWEWDTAHFMKKKRATTSKAGNGYLVKH